MDVSDLKLGETESGPLPRTSGKDFVRGSINNRPFRPGGLDDSRSVERILPEGASNGEWVREIFNGGPAQTIPPSLKHGLDFGELKVIYLFDIFVENNCLFSVLTYSKLEIQYNPLVLLIFCILFEVPSMLMECLQGSQSSPEFIS